MAQYNDSQHDNKNSTLYRMTKHDDTHHNNKKCDTQYNDKVQRHVMLYAEYQYSECHFGDERCNP